LSPITTERLELITPLRWHGHLRDKPARLSWGYGYEVELSAVEFEGNLLPARGGLRIGYTSKPNDSSLPEVHAGEVNPDGHPSPELLSRLQAANIRTLRTDRDGALPVLMDGKHIEVSCFIECPANEAESSQTQTPNDEQDSQQ
jgi:hypothetical protein